MKVEYAATTEQAPPSNFTTEAGMRLIQECSEPTELWVYFTPMKLDGRIARLKRSALAIASSDGLRLTGEYKVEIGDRFRDVTELWGLLCYRESDDELLCGNKLHCPDKTVDGIEIKAFHPEARLSFDVVAHQIIVAQDGGQIPPKLLLNQAEALAAQRHEARRRKDWETSDRLRNQIQELGYRVIDYKDGYRLVMHKSRGLA